MESNIDHAKQFMPFDALKGLDAALKEKEIIKQDKKILCDNKINDLEYKFNKVNTGVRLNVTYYKNNSYISYTGVITKIDYVKKIIIMDKKEIIYTSDIVEIEY